jgi:hypothetical protein
VAGIVLVAARTIYMLILIHKIMNVNYKISIARIAAQKWTRWKEMTNEEAIEILSDMRAEYNLWGDENEATRYHVLSWAIQAMQAKPKHAYVIVDEDGNMECSNCGSSNCFDNYCGTCGAKLIGERRDDGESC